MEIIDYNGVGAWTAERIRARYAAYAAEAGIVPRDLAPVEQVEGERRWIYPVMDRVIPGIDEGDPACIRIGIEFIEEDRGFPFGRILKAKTARTLRRAPLTPEQERRILDRIFSMLRQGNVPREYREYARLARRIGFRKDEVPEIVPQNEYVERYCRYFLREASAGG